MEEEDAHYCLRCRMTIQGLENYILHRRQKCQSSNFLNKPTDHGQSNQPTHSPYLSMARGSSSSSLSRYLQVPSKSSVSDPILSSSSNHHMEERYNKTRHGSENPLVADLSVETSADDFMSHLGLCMVSSTTWAAADIHSEEPLRADDFFSLLELQSCKGAESSRHRPRRSLEPATPSLNETLKSESESIQTEDQHDSTFPDLNSSHDSAVVELPSNEELADNSGLLAVGDVTSAFSSPEVANTSPTAPEMDSVHPASEPAIDTSSDLTTSTPQSTKLPYPSRGKWMPGLKPRVIHKAGSSVEYHCKPCNRRLTGRVVFEKHLQSELHFKRTAQQLATDDGPKYGLRRKKEDCIAEQAEREVDVLQDDEVADDPWWMNKRQKKGEKNAQRCPTCSVWVPKPLFGKHLVSRYHISRSHKHSERDRCILDHIHLIVLEAPFQCRLCRFYCHSHADLLSMSRFNPLYLPPIPF